MNGLPQWFAWKLEDRSGCVLEGFPRQGPSISASGQHMYLADPLNGVGYHLSIERWLWDTYVFFHGIGRTDDLLPLRHDIDPSEFGSKDGVLEHFQETPIEDGFELRYTMSYDRILTLFLRWDPCARW
jgi:hypothetical protein